MIDYRIQRFENRDSRLHKHYLQKAGSKYINGTMLIDLRQNIASEVKKRASFCRSDRRIFDNLGWYI